MNGQGGALNVEYWKMPGTSQPGPHGCNQAAILTHMSEWDNPAYYRDCYHAWTTYGTGTSAVSGWGLFNKWLVKSISEVDLVTGSPTKVTSYEYLDGPGWHEPTAAEDPGKWDYKSWNVWRGHSAVRATVGSGATATTTEYRQYRGLNGDPTGLQGAGSRSVNVWTPEGVPKTDWDYLEGRTLGTAQYAPKPKEAALALVNGSFDSIGTSGWSTTMTNAVDYRAPDRAMDGTAFRETNQTGTTGSLWQDVSFTPVVGRSYRFEIWVRNPTGGTATGSVVLWGLGTSNVNAGTGFSAGPYSAWQRVSATWTATANNTTIFAPRCTWPTTASSTTSITPR